MKMTIKEYDDLDKEIISEKPFSQKRWHTIWEEIAVIDGVTYRGYVLRGSTESQDVDDDEEVELRQVRQVEKLMNVYEDVEN